MAIITKKGAMLGSETCHRSTEEVRCNGFLIEWRGTGDEINIAAEMGSEIKGAKDGDNKVAGSVRCWR